ncbi:17.7g1 protein [Bracoviriform inaniti]|uniref:17.7g1 protein n=1 Tax=Bracoviriform inaniti TaxID=36344 RepID=A8E103_9VIRU|nr:17.7g1 protein [Bracoviriform inaniti]CAO98973.1 17.7g1 protein [Bracoviriform inaniti]
MGTVSLARLLTQIIENSLDINGIQKEKTYLHQESDQSFNEFQLKFVNLRIYDKVLDVLDRTIFKNRNKQRTLVDRIRLSFGNFLRLRTAQSPNFLDASKIPLFKSLKINQMQLCLKGTSGID